MRVIVIAIAILLSIRSFGQKESFNLLVPFECIGCKQDRYLTTNWLQIYQGGLGNGDYLGASQMLPTSGVAIETIKEVRQFNFKPFGYTVLVEVNHYHYETVIIVSPIGEMWRVIAIGSGEVNLFETDGQYFLWTQNPVQNKIYITPLYEDFNIMDEYIISLDYMPEGTDYHIYLDKVRYKDGILFFEAHYRYPDGSEGEIIESVDLFHGSQGSTTHG